MNIAMIWPIALIVFSNVFYHICSKETPQDVHPMATLTITYLVGAVVSAVLYFLLNRGGDLMQEYRHINWTTFVLGIVIVGLEAGSLYMYKAGWNVSSGQLVHSIILAICLVIVGVAIYHETISITKIIGVAVCLVGLFLINK